ncbi:membrane transport family protein [Heliorestis convoluta]|uniref:Membrane transport family protein n=2 Tax=Heliorestis convoluta TaxID=356322 RepID=A0A5Q2N3Z3_9FIRM|nr:membrane transport family protein [Heliorestis convoluta]
MILYHLPQVTFDSSSVIPIATSWMVFAGSYLFFSFLAWLKSWPEKVTVCLIITAGLGNTSFIGFPVIETLVGSEGLQYAIMADQPGTFLILTTVGLFLIKKATQSSSSIIDTIKGLFLFPPFMAFIVGLMINYFGIVMPEALSLALLGIAGTVSPLALFSVGLQLKWPKQHIYLPFLSFGLLYKLILAPLLTLLVWYVLAGKTGMEVTVSILEAAMAPMITAAIIVATYKIKSNLATMMIGIGIPLSIFSLAIWYYVLTLLGLL